ncbi:hypothetical protein Pcinc_001611 [Petrolisthes cinctipes]|uniref:Uncharacterized protein n=1 Tax=Petrolisthes cinctipes TaxID=88211 RepID=A0AAE1GR49_PETCI|nr:hypothetical protein Pcinc_001611 [Petrolisthes cinctipes]
MTQQHLEQIVRENVEAELESISADSVRGSKTVKDITATIMPGITNIIVVTVSSTVSTVIKDFNKMVRNKGVIYSVTPIMTGWSSTYMRRDKLRIFDIEEDPDEDQDVIQAKVIEV